jgi:hypothetical protein
MTKKEAEKIQALAEIDVHGRFPGATKLLSSDVYEELIAAAAARLVLTQAGGEFRQAQDLIRAALCGEVPDE